MMTEHELSSFLIGSSAIMQSLRAKIVRLAPVPLAVLIQGPTGAGKEVVAQAIHRASGCSGKLVSFNVSGITDSMFEDTLFGHVQGAFTGAVRATRGYLREADRGTVFLDEIGDLRSSSQVSLLRALDTHTFRPVGGSDDCQSEFRVVSATNADLVALAASGDFRKDLLHRLAAITITVPPLRERPDDIDVLVTHFVSRLRYPACAVSFTPLALHQLRTYPWPGNVRELKHAVELLAYCAESPVITDRTVAVFLDKRSVTASLAARQANKRAELTTLLAQYGNDVASVATHYGRSRSTIYRWLEECGIPTPERVHVRVNPDSISTYSPAIPNMNENKQEHDGGATP